jgi:hypothetical protein
MNFFRYHCLACNLLFTCDLESTEIACCPLCANPHPELVDEMRITLCSDCSITIKEADAIRCDCGRPLCDVCGHIADACAKCRGSAVDDLVEDPEPRRETIM